MSMCSLPEYYAERAAEIDAGYLAAELQPDLARLRELLPRLVTGRRVLEIEAGTGFWTQVLAPAAASLTAIDGNAEMVAIAAQRSYGNAEVRLARADLGRLETVTGDFDLVFCGFFWSRLDAAEQARALAAVRARAGPGATLVLAGRHYPGSGALAADLAGMADGIERTELDHFWLATGVLP